MARGGPAGAALWPKLCQGRQNASQVSMAGGTALARRPDAVSRHPFPCRPQAAGRPLPVASECTRQRASPRMHGEGPRNRPAAPHTDGEALRCSPSRPAAVSPRAHASARQRRPAREHMPEAWTPSGLLTNRQKANTRAMCHDNLDVLFEYSGIRCSWIPVQGRAVTLPREPGRATMERPPTTIMSRARSPAPEGRTGSLGRKSAAPSTWAQRDPSVSWPGGGSSLRRRPPGLAGAPRSIPPRSRGLSSSTSRKDVWSFGD
jgi:hypothetical protein